MADNKFSALTLDEICAQLRIHRNIVTPTITLATAWSNVSSITSTSTSMSQVVVDSLHMAVNTAYTCARLAPHPFVWHGRDFRFTSYLRALGNDLMRIDIHKWLTKHERTSSAAAARMLQEQDRQCRQFESKRNCGHPERQLAAVDKVYVARNDSVHDVSLYDGPFLVTTTAQC